MSRLADPTLCPDCRTRLPEDGGQVCPGCALDLRGPDGARLWSCMLAADEVVSSIRRRTALAATPAPAPGGTPGTAGPRRAGRPLLPSGSVPALLLGLGAVCLGVAIVVFAAVAWGSLSLGTKAVILVGVTGALGRLAAVVTRRGLRAAAETLWATTVLSALVDLFSARSAGLLGMDGLGERAFATLVAATLVALGLGATGYARHLRLPSLTSAEVATGVGVTVATAAHVWASDRSPVGIDAVWAVPVLLLVAVALLRGRQRVAGAWAVSLAVLTAAGLATLGLAHGADAWLAGGWSAPRWELVVVAVFAIAPVPRAARSESPLARPVAVLLCALAAGALLVGALLSTPDVPALVTVLTLGVAALAAPAVRLRPRLPLSVPRSIDTRGRPWAPAADAATRGSHAVAVSGAALLAAVGALMVAQLLSSVPFGRELWSTSATQHLARPDLLLPWWHLPAAVASVGVAAGARWATRAAPAVAGAVALSLVLCLPVLAPPLWLLALAGGLLATALLAAAGTPLTVAGGATGRTALAAVGAAAAGVAALAVAPSGVLTALAATLVASLALAVAVLGREAADGAEVAWPLGTGLAGLAAMAWGSVAGAMPTWGSVSAVLVVTALALLAGRLRTTAAARAATDVVALGAGAVAVAVTQEPGWTVGVLTLVGAATCLVSVVLHDRADAGWLGAAVLAASAALRLEWLGDPAPERYTLPLACLLVAAGAVRLHRDPQLPSTRALGSGLSLGLLPSLLLALPDPVSARGLLLGLAGLAVLAAGLERRWAAPLVAGALTTALLAVRHLTPVADAVPRWVLLGVAGAALLWVGVTWEQRRRQAHVAGRYVADLR